MARKKMTKEDLMEMLYVQAAEQLIAKLRSGEAGPQDYKNAIQFLKDNQITCEVKHGPTDLMQELLDELPFDEEMN